MDIILNRRSVRDFDLSKQISYDELLELCRYGEAAPSARNQRGREYIIVDDMKTILELSQVSKGSMILSKCNTLIALVAKNKDELPTPLMLEQDLACSVENILLRATEKGFGSCYIGIHPISERISACDQIFKLSNGMHTFALIALGYPLKADSFYDKEKFDESLVHHNTY